MSFFDCCFRKNSIPVVEVYNSDQIQGYNGGNGGSENEEHYVSYAQQPGDNTWQNNFGPIRKEQYDASSYGYGPTRATAGSNDEIDDNFISDMSAVEDMPYMKSPNSCLKNNKTRIIAIVAAVLLTITVVALIIILTAPAAPVVVAGGAAAIGGTMGSASVLTGTVGAILGSASTAGAAVGGTVVAGGAAVSTGTALLFTGVTIALTSILVSIGIIVCRKRAMMKHQFHAELMSERE